MESQTAGTQEYGPSGIVHDHTDKGPPWDVTLNYRSYWYDVSSQVFTSGGGAGLGATEQTSEGVGWLSFTGQWGDAQWPRKRPGQYCLGDQCHISSGPTGASPQLFANSVLIVITCCLGPFLKNLGRTAVCENESSCPIKT